MAHATTPVAGVNLDQVTTTPTVAVGTQVFGSDGKLYVYAKASGAIAASDTDCAVNASTFAAAATGGAYTSPATAMVTNDYGWFGKASV